MKNNELNIWISIEEKNVIDKLEYEMNILNYYNKEYSTLNPISDTEFELVEKSKWIIDNCIQKIKNNNWKVAGIDLIEIESNSQELFDKIQLKKAMSD